MILLSIFENHGNTDIDLYFKNFSLSPPLYMGIIFAIFISSGKIPWTKELLNIYLSDFTIKSKTLLIVLKDISSYAGLSLVFKEQNAFLTSSSLNVAALVNIFQKFLVC